MIVNGLKEYESLKPSDLQNGTKAKEVELGALPVFNETSHFYAKSTGSNENLNLLTYDDKNQQVDDNKAKEVLVNTEAKLLQQTNTMSSKDMEELANEDKAIEDYEVDELELALSRVKEQRASYEEHIEDQVIKLEEKAESIKDMKSISSSPSKKYIIEKLEQADLPITEENINRMADLLQMSEVIGNMSDKTYRYMIQNNLAINIHNIYKSSYAGSNTSYPSISQEVLKQLEDKINQVVEDSFLAVNDETVGMAKWLLNNQLPLTKQNLWQLKDLTDLKNHFNKDKVMDRILNGFKKGEPLEHVNLATSDKERSQSVVEILNSLEQIDDSLEQIIKNGEKLTIKNLYDYENKNNKSGSYVKGNKETGSQEPSTDIKIETITARRQLEEIRLKLTVESGAKLIKNGLSIEVMELSRLVEELKELEQEYYRNLLKENGVSDTIDNVNIMKDSYDKLTELKTVPSFILGRTLITRGEETIDTLTLGGEKLKNDFIKANLSYEPLLTSPRKDMGDSIQKAFANIDAILEDMKLPVTHDNVRAVKILGYNNMEISNENLEQVKAYDMEVNHMLKNLTPAVTAAFIKKGINPLDIPIQELNKQINEVKNEIGISEDEKYSKFLYKLEKNHEISKEEKESYIGIYRLLNHIDKSDGSALGYVLNTKKEVNLQNLLSGIRTLQGGGITADIDDSFGVLSDISYKRERITDQINTAFHSDLDASKGRDEYTILKHTISNLKEDMTPNLLKEVSQTENIYQMPLELLYDKVSNNEEARESEADYYTEKRDEYAQKIKNSSSEINFLSDSNLAVTIKNIFNVSDFFSSKASPFHKLEEAVKEFADEEYESYMKEMASISKDLIDSFSSKEEISTSLDKTSEKLMSYLNKLYDNPNLSSKELKELQRINNGMFFMKDMAKRECYEIPLVIDDEITNVNLTLIHNTKEQGKVTIKSNFQQLGDVTISLFVKQNDVSGLIKVSNTSGLAQIKQSRSELQALFKEINFTSNNVSVSLDKSSKRNTYEGLIPMSEGDDLVAEKAESDSTTKTDTLYDVAKTVLVYLKRMDNRLNIE